MTFFQKIYTVIWIITFIYALWLFFSDRKSFNLFHKKYLLFLLKPWKIITMGISIIFITFIGPYSGDYTWDYVDGFIMSVLTCFTAPWVVGIFYLFRMKKALLKQVFVAFCIWMFSVTWFFDLYIYFRDNSYPTVWLPNIALSSMLYWCAGFLWNLDWNSEKGIFFSFTYEGKWFSLSANCVFWKIMKRGWIYIAIVFILFGGVIYGLHNDGRLFPWQK